jgi:acyl-CoA thioester hydrolase
MEPFRHTHRVTYADCTVGNHVYYGRYLALLEAARGEWFRSLGKSFDDWHQRDGLIFPVLEVHLTYRSPARYDEVLTTEVRVAAARGVRLNLAYRVLAADGRLVLEGQTLHVCTNLEDKPRRFPSELIAALGPLAPSADEAKD